jgi:hypothetical protein
MKPDMVLPQPPSPILTVPAQTTKAAQPRPQEMQAAAAAVKASRPFPALSEDTFGLATTLKREALLYMKMRQQFVQLVKMYQTIQQHRQQLQTALNRP